MKLVETLAPLRLSRDFRWLLASSWVAALGDGIALASGPLLVASLTPDPVLVAFAALLRWAPPMLFGLAAGAVGPARPPPHHHGRRRRPLWFAFAGSAVFVVALWRELSRIAHDETTMPTTATG